jgi:hypothetical protein
LHLRGEDFDLMRLTKGGKPGGEGDEGDWYCSQHFRRERGAYRIVAEETAGGGGPMKD